MIVGSEYARHFMKQSYVEGSCYHYANASLETNALKTEFSCSI